MNEEQSIARPYFFIASLFLIILHLWSRYAAAPVVDFAGDSWNFLAIGLQNTGLREALGLFLNEPDRPVQAVLITLLYQCFGDSPASYAFYSMAGYVLHFILSMVVVQKLSRDRCVTLLFGLLYAVLPNVFESFQWGAMIGVLYMQVFYMLSALFWVLYLERNKIAYSILAAIFYVAAVASYEFGIFLPAVFMLLVPLKEWPRKIPGLLPFIFVGLLYLVWRFTGGFGQAEGLHFTQRHPTFALWALKENGLAIISWWIGPRMLGCALKGLNAFLQIPRSLQLILMIGNLVALTMAWSLLTKLFRRSEDERPAYSGRLLLFALAWFAFGNALSLISWTAPRLNFFPAFGALLAVALVVRRVPIAYSKGVLLLLLLLGLCANQGNSQAWKISGEFHRNIYSFLEEHQNVWKDVMVVFFDYKNMPDPLSKGFFPIGRKHHDDWAYYENASLMRGFVPEGMLRVLAPGTSLPQVAFSTIEHEAYFEGDTLRWHRKYTPENVWEAPLEKVFSVDCYTVGFEIGYE